MQYLVDNNISVACITESWLTDSNDFTTFRIKSYGYSVSHKHRELRRGGGVCFIYKLSNKVIESKSKRIYESFEYHLLELCMPCNDSNIVIICIYRKQEISFTQFHAEFSHFCEDLIEQFLNSFLVLGDFNVHCESNTYMANQLLSILSSYGLTQHIESATHKSGHMIDLVFSNVYEIPLQSIIIDDVIAENLFYKFDHFPITFNIQFTSPEQGESFIVKDVRNINAIDIDEFNEMYLRPFVTKLLPI